MVHKICQNHLKILPNTLWTRSKWPKFYTLVPRWQNFNKSSHTAWASKNGPGKRRQIWCDNEREGERVWPDLAKFCHFGKTLQVFGLFLIWQNAEPTLANLWHYWANFHCCKWSYLKNNITIWSHWREKKEGKIGKRTKQSAFKEITKLV